MSTVDERRVAAVVGALVADAAAEPLNWIYSDDILNGIIEGKEEIEFLSPSHNPFYEVKTGENSCYGDQEFLILKELVSCNGVDTEHMKKSIFETFGPGSIYDKAAQEKEKTVCERMPGPYRNGSMRDFIEKYRTGNKDASSPTDIEIDCVIRTIPVVALYAGRPEMMEKVSEVLQISHTAPVAVTVATIAARLLERFILTGECKDAVEQTMSALSADNAAILKAALDVKTDAHNEVAKKFGKACSLPGAFQIAVHAIINSSDFIGPVRMTSRAGGSNCSRSGFIGACMGAQYGLSSIPESWTSRTKRYPEIKKLADELITILH